jgi:hypothetical protein
MMHLLAVEGCLKLLADDATENLQRALPIVFGKSFPKSTQVYPLIPRLRWPKKTLSLLWDMTLLLESSCDRLDTNPPASKKRIPILSETYKRVDTGQLCVHCVSYFCNFSKGSDLAGIDGVTNQITRLFNPRDDRWHEHFVVHQVTIGGRTAKGRVTVRVLNMNTLIRLRLRSKIKSLGLTWP